MRIGLKASVTCTLWVHMGHFFLGHMHPPVRSFISTKIKECHQDLMFLSYREKCCSNWAPCEQSIKKFNIISTGVTYRCKLILMIGIAYDNTKYALNYHYLRWKGHLDKYDSISQAMSMLNRTYEFIHQMFDTAIVVDPATKVHVIFLNKISGPTRAKWQWRPTLASRGGRMYHHMSLGTDRWSKSWVKPAFRHDTVVGPCGSPGNIDILSYSYHGGA